MKQSHKKHFQNTLKSFSTGDMSAEVFCADIEEFVNFELDLSHASEHEKSMVKELFDVVTWFNPFENERNDYPGFRDEGALTAAANKFSEKLRDKGL